MKQKVAASYAIVLALAMMLSASPAMIMPPNIFASSDGDSSDGGGDSSDGGGSEGDDSGSSEESDPSDSEQPETEPETEVPDDETVPETEPELVTCPDGSQAATTAECPTAATTTTPATELVDCPDGSQAATATECPTATAPLSPDSFYCKYNPTSDLCTKTPTTPTDTTTPTLSFTPPDIDIGNFPQVPADPVAFCKANPNTPGCKDITPPPATPPAGQTPPPPTTPAPQQVEVPKNPDGSCPPGSFSVGSGGNAGQPGTGSSLCIKNVTPPPATTEQGLVPQTLAPQTLTPLSCRDGTAPGANGICQDGTAPGANGICQDGTAPVNGVCQDAMPPFNGVCNDGTAPVNGVCQDGTKPYPNGVCQDGTTPGANGVCQDGSTPQLACQGNEVLDNKGGCVSIGTANAIRNGTLISLGGGKYQLTTVPPVPNTNTIAPICPFTSHLVGSKCVVNGAICPPGTAQDGDTCTLEQAHYNIPSNVGKLQDGTCPSGYHSISDADPQCEINSQQKLLNGKCPDGHVLTRDDKCVIPPVLPGTSTGPTGGGFIQLVPVKPDQ